MYLIMLIKVIMYVDLHIADMRNIAFGTRQHMLVKFKNSIQSQFPIILITMVASIMFARTNIILSMAVHQTILRLYV